MSKIFVEDTEMKDIADAIREKNGTDNTYKPSEMPQAIKDIQSGGGDIGLQLINDSVKNNPGLGFGIFRNNTKIEEIPNIDFSPLLIFSNMFSGCLSLKSINIDTSKGTSFQNFCLNCGSLESVTLTTTKNANQLSAAFSNCVLLKSIRTLDFSSMSNSITCFSKCYALEDLDIEGEIKVSIVLKDSSKLTNESIMSIINALADLTGLDAQTITFHTDVKAKLTDEQIATITGKNWTLA